MLPEADEFSVATLRELRNRHRSSALVAPIVSDGLRALEDARRLSGAETSADVAALEGFLADVLISVAQSGEELLLAQQLSASALSRIMAVGNNITERTKSLAVHAALLSAIAQKAAGDLDSAFVTVETRQRELAGALDTDWRDLIPLRRQRALMLQREDAFVELANDAGVYRLTHPAEYYATVKRVFEYLLNHCRTEAARTLFPPFRMAYARAAPKLPPIAHVSFLKNAGHYLALDGYPRKGSAVLVHALRAAAQFGMHGQVRQINRLLSEMSAETPRLETFHV